MGECDGTVASQVSFPNCHSREIRLLFKPRTSELPLPETHFPENVRDGCQTSQNKTQRDNRRLCHSFSKSIIICPRPSKVTGWQGRHGQISAARSIWHSSACKKPTVEQIRRANAWVRRAHQFVDLQLTCLSIPPEKLRFVTHTDCSSKDQDGTGWTQGGYIVAATDSSTGAGNMAPWSPLVWKSHKLKQGCTSTLAGDAKV